MSNVIKAALAALCTLPLTACLATVEDEGNEEFARKQSAIIRGAEFTNAEAAASGIVNIGGCTGSLVNNRWVISAAHCITGTDNNNDNQLDVVGDRSARFGNESDASRLVIPVDRVVKHPNATFGSAAGTDVILLRLTQDAPTNNLPTKHFTSLGRLALYNGTNASLMGQQITLMGYGANAGGYPSSTGYGTLREGFNPVTWTSPTLVQVSAADGTHLTCNGDSGGPSFLDVTNSSGQLVSRKLVGIHSTSSCDAPNGTSTDAGIQGFRDWVVTTVLASGSKVAEWGDSVLGNSYNGCTFTQTFGTGGGGYEYKEYSIKCDFGNYKMGVEKSIPSSSWIAPTCRFHPVAGGISVRGSGSCDNWRVYLN